jgi:hypothetical protein
MLTHKQPRTQALANAAVKAEFDKLSDEFSLIDEFLQACTSQDMTQAQRAEKIRTPNLPWLGWSLAMASTHHRWLR